MRPNLSPRRVGISALFLMAFSLHASLVTAADTNDDRAQRFIAAYERDIRPLDTTLALAWWKANTSGDDADFAAKVEAENRYNAALSDKERFAELKAIHDGEIDDPILARQIEVIYLLMLGKQVDATLLQKMSAKANDIEKAFNVYRANVAAEELTDSQVRKVLSESKDSARRQAVWEASKGVGSAVEMDLKELVLLRNDAARQLGFKNYHAMQLELNEQDPAEVLQLFDELDALTRQPFADAKADIDARLADSYGIEVDELRPWHYHDPFFQQAPSVYETNLDEVYESADILDICRKFYAGINLPIEDVIERSDLYERAGKSPHAFCTDIDREGDVRVLANIVPNEYWMGTMLHELGHSVYSSKFIPDSVPYSLRTASHILTTEGVAMMFQRFSKNADWLQEMGVQVADPQAFNKAGATMRRNELLIFSRWCQVMLRFEMGLYNDPGQDLNKLWWDLVERYQMLTRPEGRNAPDYASKIHVVSAPCYYHNYMMGEMFACQVHHTIARQILKSDNPSKAYYTASEQVGAFVKDKVIAPGQTLSWNDLTQYATGETLNAKAFAADFSDR